MAKGNKTGKGGFADNPQNINRNGRPKIGCTIADILNSKLDEVEDGKTQREIILEKVLSLAIDGSPWAIHFLADRTEGRSVERIIKQETSDEIIVI